jgi:hypothetical protein
MHSLSESQYSFLRQLFFEGYSGGRHKGLRWTRSEIRDKYQEIVPGGKDFSEALDTLVYRKFLKMEISPSGSLVHYFLTRMAVDYLAAESSGFDSSAWTGMNVKNSLSSSEKDLLIDGLKSIEARLDGLGLSNEEKSSVVSYVVAARILAESPEPPLQIIWLILERLNNFSGVAALLLSIFAILSSS